jgi:uncharacterized protein
MRPNYTNITQKIKKTIEEIDPSAEVILFGSRARGEAKKDSDWDILILVDKPKVTFKDEQVFNHKLYDVGLETNQCIMAFVRSKKEWNTKHYVTPLYKNIQKEGMLL